MANMEMDGGIKIYLREIGKTDLLTPEQEVELAERIKKGDPEARSHMIRANLRLVVKIAQDYQNYGLPLLDLISEGNIGLMKAVERFDPNKGGKLSTYAAWWIKQSIKRALANQSKTIRLPVHMIDKISKMRRVAMAMSEELGREPTDDELSEEVGIDRAKLSQLKVASMRPASLDAPISEDDSTEFGEIIGDETAQTPFEMLSHKNMHGQVDGLLTVLDERERKIIDARFGLNGQKARTLEEVGQEFGVTRERIRQLQNIALRKLRRALQKKDDPIPKALGNARLKNKKPKGRASAPSLTAPPLGTFQPGVDVQTFLSQILGTGSARRGIFSEKDGQVTSNNGLSEPISERPIVSGEVPFSIDSKAQYDYVLALLRKDMVTNPDVKDSMEGFLAIPPSIATVPMTAKLREFDLPGIKMLIPAGGRRSKQGVNWYMLILRMYYFKYRKITYKPENLSIPKANLQLLLREISEAFRSVQ